jgi:hypothetical protein
MSTILHIPLTSAQMAPPPVLQVKGNRYIYPKPPGNKKKHKRDAAAFVAARARLPVTLKPKVSAAPQLKAMSPPCPEQALPQKAGFPSMVKAPPKPTRKPALKAVPAWLSDPTPTQVALPPLMAQANSSSAQDKGIVVHVQIKDMSLT